MSLIFRGFGRKQQFLGNFGKFSKIVKKFLQKIQKIHYFSIFFEKFNKPCVTFSRVLMKSRNCWEILRKLWKILKKFNRKIKFLTMFGKVFAKNRAFGNNIIFLEQFFPFRWRTFHIFLPGGVYATISPLTA